MRCERALLIALAASSCVRSTGFPDPQPLANAAVVDGKDVLLERVSVEAQPGGGEYVDGKTVRIVAGIDDLTFIVTLGALDNSVTAIRPHGAPALSATDGPSSEELYEALEGEVVVSEGDGSIGSQLTVDITGARLVHVCTAEEIVVDSATITGKVVEITVGAAELGVGGNVFSPSIAHPTYGSFPYLGLASGRAFTNSSGTDFFTIETAEGCFIDRPRPNSHNFAVLLHPPDFDDASTVSLSSASVKSFAFVRELSSSGAIIAQALAVNGRIIVDNAPVLEDRAEDRKARERRAALPQRRRRQLHERSTDHHRVVRIPQRHRATRAAQLTHADAI